MPKTRQQKIQERAQRMLELLQEIKEGKEKTQQPTRVVKQKIRQVQKKKKKAIKKERAKAHDEKDSRTEGVTVSKETHKEKKFQRKQWSSFLETVHGELYHRSFSNMNEVAVDYGRCVLTEAKKIIGSDGEIIINGWSVEYGCRIYKYEDQFYRTVPYTSGDHTKVSHEIIPGSGIIDRNAVAHAHTHCLKRAEEINGAVYESFSVDDYIFITIHKVILYLSYEKEGKIITKKSALKTGNDLQKVLEEYQINDINDNNLDNMFFFLDVTTEITISE